MGIGKGIVAVDDIVKFGKIVDELSEFCYMITYVPKHDTLHVVCSENDKEKLEKLKLKSYVVSRGKVYATILWRW